MIENYILETFFIKYVMFAKKKKKEKKVNCSLS